MYVFPLCILGVKQKSSSETVQSPSSNQFHQAQDQQYPPKTSHNQNQPNQHNNLGRQSGNQGRPKSGGMHPNNPSMNVSRYEFEILKVHTTFT